MFRMISELAESPTFKFNDDGFGLIGKRWIREMEDHLKRTPRQEWPSTPKCHYWFKSLLVDRTADGVAANVMTFIYERQLPFPRIGWIADGVMDRFVTGGALLVEGDGSGMTRIEARTAAFPALPETRQAWVDHIDGRKVNSRMGARILKDALYANHLYGEDHNGGKSVGATCDIALISLDSGFRWYDKGALTSPDEA